MSVNLNVLFSTDMAVARGLVAGSLEVELAAVTTTVVSGDNLCVFGLRLSSGPLT